MKVFPLDKFTVPFITPAEDQCIFSGIRRMRISLLAVFHIASMVQILLFTAAI